jgi:hypothetical protein
VVVNLVEKNPVLFDQMRDKRILIGDARRSLVSDHHRLNMLGISWSAGWSPLSLAMTALAGLLEGYYWVWSRYHFVRLICALPGPKTLPLLDNILGGKHF